MKKFYSVKEASKILGVSTNTIYKYLDEGSLKGKRLNNRGRFKIPFSEIAPYLAEEAPAAAKKTGDKLTVFELWLGVSLVGLVVIYVLWNLQTPLLTDVGNAVMGYSGRTFSGFGSLISRVLPAQPTTEVVSKPLTDIATERDIPDLSYKIQETEGRTNELYANAQVLSASTEGLLGKSKTLTSAELTDAIGEMLQLLGTLSDLPDKKTIFAEINWLGESWNFSSIESIKRAASQVSYILVSLQRQSLGAFTKPDLADLNNLVSQTDVLQGLVGNIPDTSNAKTLYGDIKSVEVLIQALDTKILKIDKILESWDSYGISEKENAIKIILSESLSLNILPLPSQGQDTDLKNSLLSAKGVLTANKIYLAQKAGKPVVATWLEKGNGTIFKILVVNPSALVGQEAAIKYYLPAEVKKENVSYADQALGLNFDSQKNQYYVEANLFLGAGETKTLSLNVNESTARKEPVANLPQVAGLATFDFPIRSIVIWGSGIVLFSAFTFLVIYLLIYLKATVTERRHNKAEQPKRAEEYSILTAVEKTPTPDVVVMPSPVKSHATTTFFANIISAVLKIPATVTTFISKIVSLITKLTVSTITGLANLIISIVASLKRSFLAILHAITTFFVNITSAVTKAVSAIIRALLKIPVSIMTFFSRAVSLITNFIWAILGFFKRGILAAAYAITRFFTNVTSAITRTITSIKTGIITILVSIATFFSKIVSLITNFIVAVGSSLKRGVFAVIHTIATFFAHIMSSITVFMVSVASAAIGAIISITNLIVATFAFLKRCILSVIYAITTFIVNTASALTAFFAKILSSAITFITNVISAITKATTSVIRGLQKVLVSTSRFFLKVLFSITKTLASVIRRLLKVLVSISKLMESTLKELNFGTPR